MKEINISIEDLINNYSEDYEIEIESPDGWVSINEFVLKEPKQIYELTLDNDMSLKASYNHLIETECNYFIHMQDLRVGDKVHTSLGVSYVKSISKLDTEVVYDMSVDHPNQRYYAQGISSHNTPGTGKTTSARILSRAINCLNNQNGEPCNECKHCKEHLEGSYPDYIEVDGTSYNKVEDAKRLVEMASQYPLIKGGYRVVMIDEAHRLSNAAWDKFLILLESADVKTIFIFATTDLHLFRPAIISRCFVFQIKPLSAKDIAKELLTICKGEKVPYAMDAINKLAYHYANKPRDAVKTLDMYIRAKGGFTDYEKETQESVLLRCFKLAYFNKHEEYLEILDTLESNKLFMNISRMINEVFLYPNVAPILIEPRLIEEFKNLVDNQNFRLIIKDIMTFKPDDVYSLILLLAQVSALGDKLQSKTKAESTHKGRRFIKDELKPTVIDTTQSNAVNVDDIDEFEEIKPEIKVTNIEEPKNTESQQDSDETEGDDEIGVELDDGDLPSVSQKTDDVNLGAYGFKEVK